MGSNPYKKPDPAILMPLLSEYGTVPSQTVIIGDGLNDIMLAKNAGAVSCAHLNGLCVREKLRSLRPDYVYEDITDLRELFE